MIQLKLAFLLSVSVLEHQRLQLISQHGFVFTNLRAFIFNLEQILVISIHIGLQTLNSFKKSVDFLLFNSELVVQFLFILL